MSTEIFFGDDRDYEKYLKDNPHVKRELDENRSDKLQDTGGSIVRISSSDITPISEDDLNLISGVRIRHEYSNVYMQPDINFYDSIYKNDIDIVVDMELFNKAKTIKRIYRNNCMAYYKACAIREEYMQALIDAFGGDESDVVNAINMGSAKHIWVPPIPRYASSSNDYSLVMNGYIDLSDVVSQDYEGFKEIFDEYLKEMGDCEINVTESPILNPAYNDRLVKKFDENASLNSTTYHSDKLFKTNSWTLADFENQLRSICGVGDDNDVDDSNKNDPKILSRTPDNIKHSFITDGSITPNISLRDALNGLPYENDVSNNSNDVVYDSYNRPISKREKMLKDMVKLLVAGGWDEHQLMKLYKLGTRRELQSMERNANRRKKKKPSSFIDDSLFGNDNSMDDYESADSYDSLLDMLR